MAKALTVETIFTGVDQFSAVVIGMGRASANFADKTASAIHKADKAFKNLIPSIGHTTKHLIEAYATFDAVGKIEQGIEFVMETFEEFDEKIGDLQATLGLSDQAFQAVKDSVLDVANATGKSAVSVTDVYKAAVKANPELRDNSESLKQVAEASILAAEATGTEFTGATESLMLVLNKFNISADKATETVDIFAATSREGQYNLAALEDGVSKFGATAQKLGMSLNESAALVQLSSQFKAAGEGATDSGSHIQKFLSSLQNIRKQSPDTIALLEQNGVSLAKLRSNTVPVSEKLEELAKIQNKGALITTVFGKKQAEFVFGLLEHRKALEPLIEKTKERGVAEEMAARREATLKESIDNLKAAFQNVLLSNSDATDAVSDFSKGLQFLTKHMKTILKTGWLVVKLYVAWKAIVLASTIIQTGYNIVIGISEALTGTYAASIVAGSVAQKAAMVTVRAYTAAQWLWNAAMAANPIGLVIIAIAALIALVTVMIVKWDEWGAAATAVFALINWPLALIISLVQSLRRNWDAITQAFKSGDVAGGFKKIGATILDAVLMPLQQVVKLIGDITGAKWALKATEEIAKFREGMGVNVSTNESGMNLDKMGNVTGDAAGQTGAQIMALNPKQAQQDALNQTFSSSTSEQKNVTVDFKNLPAGAIVSGNGVADITPQVSPTFGK